MQRVNASPDMRPLCVDLDGTLVDTDTLPELFLAAMRLDCTVGVKFPFWLVSGKAAAKRKLAECAPLNASRLPYNRAFLDFLREEKKRGRPIVLATASDLKVAQAIASHLGLFDAVIGSDGVDNRKGPSKARALSERYGQGNFVYAGNDKADLPVWREAGAAVCVNATPRLAREIGAITKVEREFPDRRNRWRAVLKVARIHQWTKNLLVFVAPVAGHAVFDIAATAATTGAFIAFCLAASGVYIVNDVVDLDSDRAHPRKRNRPIANGSLSLYYGVLGPTLIGLGALAGLAVSLECGAVIAFYAALSLAYSADLKKRPLVDVFTLAMLYSLRVFAGGVAAQVSVSIWLLSFSGFLFLSLAFLKRMAEYSDQADGGHAVVNRRGYSASDINVLRNMGIASSFVSALVLALYVNNSAARVEYAEPAYLWGFVPLVLYWLCRLWLATSRGHMDDDPIIYAAKDWVSWLVFVLMGLFYGLATVGGPF